MFPMPTQVFVLCTEPTYTPASKIKDNKKTLEMKAFMGWRQKLGAEVAGRALWPDLKTSKHCAKIPQPLVSLNDSGSRNLSKTLLPSARHTGTRSCFKEQSIPVTEDVYTSVKLKTKSLCIPSCFPV